MTAPLRGTTPRRDGFRPDIQALRALAVVLVVGFHLFPTLIGGGYVGVDVFFVISGYLITAHLLRERDTTGKIALRAFYARRIRRLLPAAIVVLAVSLLVVVLLLPESVHRANLREIAASALYVENWTLALDAVDYLGAAAAPTVVQHYWSLSVEEQFYIIWPLLLLLAGLLASRGRQAQRRTGIAVIAVVAVASFAYGVWITVADPAWAYFVTPARSWEFAAGALVAALALPERVESLPRSVRVVVAWVGLALIVASGLLYSAQTPFPGVAAIVPVLGATMMIAAGDPSARVSPMLLGRMRPVQYLGDISYSVYLWHWPLIVVAESITAHVVGPRTAILVVAVTLLLATLTKKFVEDPFLVRREKVRRVRGAFVAAGAAMAVVAAASLGGVAAIDTRLAAAAAAQEAAADAPCYGARALLSNECGDPYAVPADLDTAFAARDFADTTLGDCGRGNTVGAVGDTVECSFGDESSEKLVVIIGDSHAGHWIPALQKLAADREWHLVSFVRSSCPFTTITPLDRGVLQQECADWREAVLDRVAGMAPDLVIVASLTPDGYTDANFSLGIPRDVREGYVETLSELGRNAAVAVIRDTPFMGEIVPDCLGSSTLMSDCDKPQAVVLDAHEDPLRDAAEDISVPVLDITAALCSEATCHAVIGGVVTYRDHHHFTAGFARSLAPFLLSALERSGLDVP